MLCCSTSCLHAASTMPRKVSFSLSSKKHNFLPFKDKLELISVRQNPGEILSQTHEHEDK
ncbi:hypothetical protein E2C01_080926 [Portunus trituberculatus]|uniref:Uncharacterized protein n=1 Tax=Portunus trituberculatus TaxID=210409 RepID=A0A5B7INI2_PORTR|nr:hypothetical protein [Portunus trituberculatus]